MISCPILHQGISDCLAAMLSKNQEAPPKDTNKGSSCRITSLFPFFLILQPSQYLSGMLPLKSYTLVVFSHLWIDITQSASLLTHEVLSLIEEDLFGLSYMLLLIMNKKWKITGSSNKLQGQEGNSVRLFDLFDGNPKFVKACGTRHKKEKQHV